MTDVIDRAAHRTGRSDKGRTGRSPNGRTGRSDKSRAGRSDASRAGRSRSSASWHPSAGAPPGLRSAAAQARVAAADPPQRPSDWHPAAGIEQLEPTGPAGQAGPLGTSSGSQARTPRRSRLRQRPRSARNVKTGPPARRAMLLMVVSIVGLAALGARLVHVQVLESDTYAALGERQGTARRELPSVRGAILDRNLKLLAVSDDVPTIWADPRKVADPDRTAAALAAVVDIDTDKIAERLGSDRHFVYVARQVSPDEGAAVADLQLPGVGVLAESSRLRPKGDDFARGLLGVVDIDQNPLGGAEKQFAEVLDGTDGREVARIAHSGMPLPNGVEQFEPVSHGDDVVLTLHTQVQWMAESALSEAVDHSGARGAMAVVMQVDTGDVLALAGVARDPATGKIATAAHNPAYTDAFEPGSVAKSFTVAAALEAGLTTPAELHNTPVSYTYADKEFIEPYSQADRQMTTSEILVHSSNIGTIQLAERVGSAGLQRTLRSFGFGRLTGSGGVAALPGESRGILRAARQWHGTDLATIGFGHGIAVTAVQLAAAYNAIANDGVHVSPRLVLGTVVGDGTLAPAEPAATRRVLSSRTAAQMQAMLADVVRDGTGGHAAVEGYLVAGKTGTAQKPLETGGYSDTAHMSSFAGFLPAGRPEITVVIVLDEPTEYRAGLVAAPVFAKVASYALRVLQVSPDV